MLNISTCLICIYVAQFYASPTQPTLIAPSLNRFKRLKHPAPFIRAYRSHTIVSGPKPHHQIRFRIPSSRFAFFFGAAPCHSTRNSSSRKMGSKRTRKSQHGHHRCHLDLRKGARARASSPPGAHHPYPERNDAIIHKQKGKGSTHKHHTSRGAKRCQIAAYTQRIDAESAPGEILGKKGLQQ